MLTLSHISKTFNPGTVNEKKALTDSPSTWTPATSSPSSAPTGGEIHPVQRRLGQLFRG